MLWQMPEIAALQSISWSKFMVWNALEQNNYSKLSVARDVAWFFVLRRNPFLVSQCRLTHHQLANFTPDLGLAIDAQIFKVFDSGWASLNTPLPCVAVCKSCIWWRVNPSLIKFYQQLRLLQRIKGAEGAFSSSKVPAPAPMTWTNTQLINSCQNDQRNHEAQSIQSHIISSQPPGFTSSQAHSGERDDWFSKQHHAYHVLECAKDDPQNCETLTYELLFVVMCKSAPTYPNEVGKTH